MTEKDLKALVEQERKERLEKAGEILRKANEEIEALDCILVPSVLVTAQGNRAQIEILSKE